MTTITEYPGVSQVASVRTLIHLANGLRAYMAVCGLGFGPFDRLERNGTSVVNCLWCLAMRSRWR